MPGRRRARARTSVRHARTRRADRSRGDPAPHVSHGEGGPVREVALGGRPVRAEVAQGDLGERLVAVEASRRGHAIGEQGVGVLAVARHAAAHEAEHLETAEQQHELLAGELLAAVGQGAGELGAGAVGCRCEHRLDLVGERIQPRAKRLQLLLEDRHHPRRGELLQPLRVVGVHVVPGRAQHVDAQHAAVRRARRPGRPGAATSCGSRPPTPTATDSRPVRPAASAPPVRRRRPERRAAASAASNGRCRGR